MALQMVTTACPRCDNEIMVESKYLGKNVLCPHCHQMFVPPFPHSGYGIVSCWLGVLGLILEIGIIAYMVSKPYWEVENPLPSIVDHLIRFVGLLGIIATWSGIGCAVMGYRQKRRRRRTAKWGLILNILPNLFCMGYFGVKPFLPPPPKPPEPEPEEVRYYAPEAWP